MTLVRRTQLRSDEMHARYNAKPEEDGCTMCRMLKEMDSSRMWVIAPNEYPYDMIAEKHDLLIFREHIDEPIKMGLNGAFALCGRLWELEATGDYDMVTFNLPHQQSIRGHLHLHLLKLKAKGVQNK